MAKKFERECVTCGKKYQYCPHCDDFAHLPKWMSTYCGASCRELMLTTISYADKKITKEQAKERYLTCDLSYMDKLSIAMQEDIIEALDIQIEKELAAEEIEEPVVEVETEKVVTVTPQSIEDEKNTAWDCDHE